MSIADFLDSSYQPNPRLILHPLFLRGIITSLNPQFCPLEQAKTFQRFQLLIFEIVPINQNLAQYSTPCFCVELLSVTTHSSIRWNSLRSCRGVKLLIFETVLID